MTEAASTIVLQRKAQLLRRLHTDAELLVLVNVWDVASARAVADVRGCRAIATASAAIAAAHGYPDGEHIPVDLMLAAVGRIATAVDLPVTADLESGFGDVDTTIRRAVQAGVVGANIEDALRPLRQATALMEDAIRAAGAEGVPLVLNARTDVYLTSRDQSSDALLAEAVRRGRAYLDAGADCIFVPGCTNPGAISALVAAFGPGRLSLLGVPGMPGPGQLQELGVARLSHGPYPHRHALAALAKQSATLLGG